MTRNTRNPSFGARSAATCIQVAALFLVGFWCNFGGPASAFRLFGLECPILPSCEGVEVIPETASIECPTRFEFDTCSPENGWTPSSVSELQGMILKARSQNLKIRVRGACLSTPGASHDSAYYKTMDEGRDVINLYMTHMHFANYGVIDEDTEPLIVAGAGITMGRNPRLGRTWDDSLMKQMWDDGYAVEDSVGVSQVTLGGYLTTGAAGATIKHTIASNVIGLRFINGRGEKVEVWRNATDTTKHPFDAYFVSVGLLGVLYEVVLKPSPRYCIRSDGIVYSEDIDPKETKTFLSEPDHSRIFVDYFPLTGKVMGLFFKFERDYDLSHCEHTYRYETSDGGQAFSLDAIYGLKAGDSSCVTQQLKSATRASPNSYGICNVDVFRRSRETAQAVSRENAMHYDICLKSIQEQLKKIGFDGRENMDKVALAAFRSCVGPAKNSVGPTRNDDTNWVPVTTFRYYLSLPMDDWTMDVNELGYDMSEMFFSLEHYSLHDVVEVIRRKIPVQYFFRQ